MGGIWQVLYSFAIVVGLLAIEIAALYAACWFIFVIVRTIPLVGQRHKHAGWNRRS